MSLAFWSLGIGAMLLAQAIPPHLSARGLWLMGLALVAAGLFPPIATKPIVAFLHGVSRLVVILASPIVFVLAN
jgi:hypothetical protein